MPRPPLRAGFTLTYNTDDLVAIGTNHSRYGIVALYLLSWTTCRLGPGCCADKPPDPKCCNSGCKPCPSPLLHYGPTPCKAPSPDWRGDWQKTFATLAPYIANGSVVGVNLNDEQVPYARLAASVAEC